MALASDADPDPWAEAEAAVKGEGTGAPKGPDKVLAKEPKPATAPKAAEDPWAAAESAVFGDAGRVAANSAPDEVTPAAEEVEGGRGEVAEAEVAEAEVAEAEVAEAEVAEAEVAEAEVSEAEVSEAEVAEAEVSEAEVSPDVEVDTALAEDDGLDDATLLRALSALVLASPEPLSTGRLAALVGESSHGRVRGALEALAERLVEAGLGVVLAEIAGGWRYATDALLSDLVGQLFNSRKTERISPAGLETLAIIAYRQPVTKGEIEAIRGVQAGPILRTLVDRGLARVAGRADQPGSPLLYGTTREFLDRFGLARLEDLPRDGELARD